MPWHEKSKSKLGMIVKALLKQALSFQIHLPKLCCTLESESIGEKLCAFSKLPRRLLLAASLGTGSLLTTIIHSQT